MDGDTSFQKERKMLQDAAELKLKGNAAYGAREYQKAIWKYHKALLQLKAVGMEPAHGVAGLFAIELHEDDVGSRTELPQTLMEERDHLKSECYNNLAACLLIRGKPTNYEKVSEYCKSTLELDPGNLKAIYRLGTALFLMGKTEEAFQALTSTSKCQTEKQIQALLQKINDKMKASNEELKTTYRRMFETEKTSASPPATCNVNGSRWSHSTIINRNGCEEILQEPSNASSMNQCKMLIPVASIHDEMLY